MGKVKRLRLTIITTSKSWQNLECYYPVGSRSDSVSIRSRQGSSLSFTF